MPIVPSRTAEIRRLIAALDDPRARAGAAARLRVLGRRVVPHVAEDLPRLSAEARAALEPLLLELGTTESRAALARIERTRGANAAPRSSVDTDPGGGSVPGDAAGDEAALLARLRALPPPRRSEAASTSRDRAEVHLVLARAGLRLARAELLGCLETLNPDRASLYAEAAGLIGDAAFVPVLARLSATHDPASRALAALCSRERLSPRSKAIRGLPEPLRSRAAAALA